MGDTSRPSGRVFISYRRESASLAVGWLYELLVEKFGSDTIFKDVDNIKPGQDFIAKLTSAVISCDVLLAVIGPDWLDIRDEQGNRRLDDPTDWVRLEVEIALSRGICVIPLLIDKAEVPRSTDLPPKLAPLNRRQAHELSPHHFKRDVDLLLPIIEEVLTSESGPAERAETAVADARQADRRYPRDQVEWAPSASDALHGSAAKPDVTVDPYRVRAPSEWDVTHSIPRVTRGDGRARQWPSGRNRSPSGRSRARWGFMLGGAVFALVVLMSCASLISPYARSFLRREEPSPPTTGPTSASILPQSDQMLADDIILWRVKRRDSWEIVTINKEGKIVEVLASGGDDLAGQVISPDRRTVLYRTEDKRKVRTLYAVAADGSKPATALFSDNGSCPRLTRPAWTLDNHLVMACGGRRTDFESLNVITLDGRVVKTIDTKSHMGDPTVSPDGKWVVYWRNTAEIHIIGGALFAAPLQGTATPRGLTNGFLGEDAQPVFSPKGDQLLFTRYQNGTRSVQLLEFDDIGADNFAPLTDGQFNDEDPSWSPDGTEAAFRRAHSSSPDEEGITKASKLFVTSVAGGHASQVSEDPMVGSQVVWARR